MANNRLFLICKQCGESQRLLKYYPSTGWFVTTRWSQPESFRQIAHLEEWMNEHHHDKGHEEGASALGREFFDVTFEFEDDSN